MNVCSDTVRFGTFRTAYTGTSLLAPIVVALGLEGGWLTEVEGESDVAHSLRHGLRLVTISALHHGHHGRAA